MKQPPAAPALRDSWQGYEIYEICLLSRVLCFRCMHFLHENTACRCPAAFSDIESKCNIDKGFVPANHLGRKGKWHHFPELVLNSFLPIKAKKWCTWCHMMVIEGLGPSRVLKTFGHAFKHVTWSLVDQFKTRVDCREGISRLGDFRFFFGKGIQRYIASHFSHGL